MERFHSGANTAKSQASMARVAPGTATYDQRTQGTPPQGGKHGTFGAISGNFRGILGKLL
jgi:hypothetical protein